MDLEELEQRLESGGIRSNDGYLDGSGNQGRTEGIMSLMNPEVIYVCLNYILLTIPF